MGLSGRESGRGGKVMKSRAWKGKNSACDGVIHPNLERFKDSQGEIAHNGSRYSWVRKVLKENLVN